jgi:hypothetical protein
MNPSLIPRMIIWVYWWNDTDKVKPKKSDKICPSATLATTNPTWCDQGANPGLLGEMPATNHLSHGTAFRFRYQESNASLLGGNEVSQPLDHTGYTKKILKRSLLREKQIKYFARRKGHRKKTVREPLN